MDKNKKKIMAVSKASYRGVDLYELSEGTGVGFFLAGTPYIAESLQQATNYIDRWYALKNN